MTLNSTQPMQCDNLKPNPEEMSHIDHTAFCPKDQTLWVVENTEGFMNPYENTFIREVMMIGN